MNQNLRVKSRKGVNMLRFRTPPRLLTRGSICSGIIYLFFNFRGGSICRYVMKNKPEKPENTRSIKPDEGGQHAPDYPIGYSGDVDPLVRSY
jgi:hypothetical protein